jgi:hypothetical protein
MNWVIGIAVIVLVAVVVCTVNRIVSNAVRDSGRLFDDEG